MENEMKTVGKLSDNQIKELKEKHGDIFAIKVKDSEGAEHYAYLRKPKRRDLSAASVAGTKDPLKFNEVIMRQCWAGGDDAIRNDDYLFLAASGVMADIIEVGEAELEKL